MTNGRMMRDDLPCFGVAVPNFWILSLFCYISLLDGYLMWILHGCCLRALTEKRGEFTRKECFTTFGTKQI